MDDTTQSSAPATRLDAPSLRYVLVTPARNEARFVELTIQSVVAQTVKPIRWVIVSDGSTDGTDDIVKKYTARHAWIELLALPPRKERHFAGKVHAFNAGYAVVKDLEYDVIGSLDADLTFQADYFEFLLHRFAESPSLGVAGTPFREGPAMYDFRFTNIEHVSGACQLFRRECFRDIGGYVPIKEGGIDLVAVITARMKGWQTRSFLERVSEHHKRTQSAGNSGLRATFRSGYHDYLMGNPLDWQSARAIYQMTRRPFALGGCVLLAGYLWAVLKRPQRPVTKEFVRFRKREQRQRLYRFVHRGTTP